MPLHKPLLPLLAFALIALVGCGTDLPVRGGSCPGGDYSCGQLCEGSSPPANCGRDCSSSNCPIGSYCGPDDTCLVDCSSTQDDCGDGTCSAFTGQCQEPVADMGQTSVDLGPPVDMGPTDMGVCARVSVEASRITPNVVFIVDESGSMAWELDLSDGSQCPLDNGNFDCYEAGGDRSLSRWQGLRSTLLGTTDGAANEGLIDDFGGIVRFGMMSYWRDNSNACLSNRNLTSVMEGGMTYLGVIDTDANPDARDEIVVNGNFFNINPGGGTPTGAAIDWTISNLAPSALSGDDPTIFILATDGDPTSNDGCNSAGEAPGFPSVSANAETWSTNAVQRAFSAGIQTFVLAVADETQLAQDHVDELANAGVGNALNQDPPAESWRITSVAGLEAALNGIIGSQISCELELEGMVSDWDTDACSGGQIELVEGGSRTTIPCAATNGWQLIGPSTVEIRGTACDMLQAAVNASVDASFPCDSIIFG